MIFRRIYDIYLIPIELVKQIPDTDQLQFYNTLRNLSENPLQFVEVFLNKDLRIIGFAWAVIDNISKEMHINTVSIERKYQGDGKLLKQYIDHLHTLLGNTELNKVTWCTDRPAFYEKLGFKRSKQIFLEYELKKEVTNGQKEARS